MTSKTDNQIYPNFCKKASIDESTFSNFKRNSTYTRVLEHVTYERGVAYFNEFKSNNVIMSNIDKFKINDRLGNPHQYTYSNIGNFSPTTLRYIKILNDLSQYNLDNIKIVEIGAGYGGQYTVIRQLFKPKSYTFIDLAPVNNLIQKYISTLGLDDIEINFIDTQNVICNINSDLTISNYAFSECSFEVQDIYIKHILNHSNHCYMIYNNLKGYSHKEFVNKMDNPKILVSKEIPLTCETNVLITW